MRIKVLMTDKATSRAVMDERERMLSAAVSAGTEISVDCIRRGPDELDCHTDEVFAAPELVRLAVRAEREGFDAVVIYCFSDVGLEALRENVRIPVIAPGETALAAAQTLCSRFVVVTGASWNIPRTYRRMMRSAVAREKMAAVRPRDIPVEDIRISVDQTDWFSLKEAETVTTYKWEYGEPLYVRVMQDGGLSAGTHKVKLTVATRTAYIPIPLEGIKEREVTIA